MDGEAMEAIQARLQQLEVTNQNYAQHIENQAARITHLEGQQQAAQPLPADNPVVQRGSGSYNIRPFLNQKGKHAWNWHTWLFHYENAARNNNWPEDRKKSGLAAGIEGAAAELIIDIDIDENPDGTERSYDQLKLEYTHRFVSPAESQLARANFTSSRQHDKEDELAWHARCRALFRKAYPDRAYDTDEDLILKFITGLRNKVLAHHVQDGNPDTYNGALRRCQNKRATCELIDGPKYLAEPMEIGAVKRNTATAQETIDATEDQPEEDEDPEIAAVGPRQRRQAAKSKPRTAKGSHKNEKRKKFEKKKPGKCHWCQNTGHYQSQCPKYIYCRLKFLNEEGHTISGEDLRRARMEISALEEGTFVPQNQPYEAAALIEETEPDSEGDKEEDFQ